MSLSKKISKISIVGAGPGAVDLITVRGLKALQSADVVLYDALVNPDLLLETPANATKIYVGKRAGNHRFSQTKINQIMVQAALANGHVVRLKGGDPFVFGRGQEEMKYAESFGIKVDVIPGISSCIAVPELQKVPLTCRGINESFWVITATTQKGNLSQDIRLAAQSDATVIVLMGLRKLDEIIAVFKKENKAHLPIMIVQNGSRKSERCVIGDINSIKEKVVQTKLGTPAMMVIGAVVRLHPNYAKEMVLQYEGASMV